MKKIFFLLIISGISYAQIGYVEYDHPVYSFLERMKASGVISDYNSFELPKTRKQVGKWLNEINEKRQTVTSVNQKILNDFLSEFAFETDTKLNYTSAFDELSVKKIFSEKEKYLYYYIDSNRTNFFVNLLGSLNYISRSDVNSSPSNELNANTTIFKFGGIIRGSFFDKVGFEMKATNGTFFGNRRLANLQGDNKYNYKFNYGPSDNLGSDFFDQTEGFLAYQNDWMSFKIGRDRLYIGQGIIKDIVSDNSTNYDYLNFTLNYKSFEYTFIHSRLLGDLNLKTVSPGVTNKEVGIKNFVYHRFGLNLKNTTFIGIGETVIYNGRSIDLSYLNPFNFYKSAEHANQDRDNSMLFFDISNYSIRGVKIFGSLIIDDMDFSKFGASWLGNITIFNAGIYTTLLQNIVPIDFELQYLRIDPYAYSHRIKKNNYTNFGASLGAPIQPNSSTIALKFTYTPHYRFWIDLLFRYTVHGQNVLSDSGELINNGGDIETGFSSSDLPDAKFLSGPKEFTRFFNVSFSYQTIKNYFIKGGMNFLSNVNLSGSSSYYEIYAGIDLRI